MKRTLSSTTLAIAAFSASHALAGDPSVSKTREEVIAELQEAQRTGDILATDDTGRKLNELYPGLYPSKAATPGKSREEVVAELREAQRTGDILAADDTGRKLNENYPELYPQKAATPGKSREEVIAELREAQRTGDILAVDDTGRKLKEIYPGLYRQLPSFDHLEAPAAGRR